MLKGSALPLMIFYDFDCGRFKIADEFIICIQTHSKSSSRATTRDLLRLADSMFSDHAELVETCAR